MKLHFIAIIGFIFILSSSIVSAQSQGGPEYPGQQKEDQNGKTVKRWSTKGPVAVSQASEPFETKNEKSVPAGILLNVDPQRQGAVVNSNKPVVIHNQHHNTFKTQ